MHSNETEILAQISNFLRVRLQKQPDAWPEGEPLGRVGLPRAQLPRIAPRCPECDMQTNFVIAPLHQQSAFCKRGAEWKAQYAAAVKYALALEVEFTAYGEPLEQVDVFKYLGRLLAMDDNDSLCRRSVITSERPAGSGRGSRSLCVGRICRPGSVGCSTKPSSNRFCSTAARPGHCRTLR